MADLIKKPEKCRQPGLCAYQEVISEMSRVMNFRVSYITEEQYNEMMDRKKSFFYELDVFLYVHHYFLFSEDMIWPIWETQVFLHVAFSKQFVQGATSAHIQPFESPIWIAIITWIVISEICILFHNYLIWKVILKQKFIWTDHLFLSFDSFTNQCGINIPNVTVFRVSVLMARLVPLLIMSVYSATILSFLQVKTISLPFDDIEGLVQDGTFRIGYESETFFGAFLNTTNDPALITAREKHMIGLEDMPSNVIKGINKTCEDLTFALIYYNNDVYQREKACEILQIPKSVLVLWDGFMARSNSPYKRVLNRILKTFRSAGILKRMEKSVYGAKPLVTLEGQDSVDLESVLLVFKVTTFAYIVSAFILMLECLFMRLNKK